MTGYSIVKTTVSSKDNALKVINALLDDKLISCAQISAIESFYVWDNEVKNEPEYTIIMKAKTSNYSDIENTVLKHHSYEVSEIIALDISHGNKKYFDWISEVTK